MNGRGEYGTRTPRESTRPVPVITVDIDRGPGAVLLTPFSAIWDPAVERIAGGGPSYYTQHDGGWWYFSHPEGEVWFGGRRFRPIRPRGPVTVIETDPSLRVSGVQIAKVFATRGDFEQGLKQLDTDFSTLINEAITIMGGDPKVLTRSFMHKAFGDPKLMAEVQKTITTIEKSKLHPYYKQVLLPLYNEWNEYIKDPVGIVDALVQAAFGGPFGSIGPSPAHEKLKRWQDRLNAARADLNAELKRIGKEPLRSPGSVALPESWFEKGEKAAERAAGGLEDIGKVLKYVLIGVAAVGGVVVVSQLASSLKKGRESKEASPSYLERFRNGEHRPRRPRVIEGDTSKVVETKAPLALPASTG